MEPVVQAALVTGCFNLFVGVVLGYYIARRMKKLEAGLGKRLEVAKRLIEKRFEFAERLTSLIQECREATLELLPVCNNCESKDGKNASYQNVLTQANKKLHQLKELSGTVRMFLDKTVDQTLSQFIQAVDDHLFFLSPTAGSGHPPDLEAI